jgi:hypothetical protein
MKTTILALVITCCLFTACSDNEGLIPIVNDPEPITGEESELIPVSFDVGFEREILPLRSSNSNATIKNLTYLIYNNVTGTFYKQNTITNMEASINEALPEGVYTIVFVGYNTGKFMLESTNMNIAFDGSCISVMEENSELSTDIWATPDIDKKGMHLVDQFYKRINYIVEKGKENNISVTLERIVGKIEIVLEDDMPNDVVALYLSMSHYYNSLRFTATEDFADQFTGENYYPGYKRKIEISDLERSAGFTISLFSYDNENMNLEYVPYDIDLVARRYVPGTDEFSSLRLVAEKKIENVRAIKNKTVRYTGKLFDGVAYPADNAFTVTVIDEGWEDINQTF